MFPDVKWSKRVGRIKYRTLEPMTLIDPRDCRSPRLKIEAGFLFEVSVPWVARVLVSPHDPSIRRAALWHDYVLHVLELDRSIADPLMYRLAIDDGAPRWRAHLMYLAAQHLGWKKKQQRR